MIKSMTGFGRCEAVTDECKISVEIKAVNHRYLDLSIKMPKKFNYFEAAGTLLPHEQKLVEALEEESIFRQMATVIKTSNGDRKIPIVTSKGEAVWMDEEQQYSLSDDTFGLTHANHILHQIVFLLYFFHIYIWIYSIQNIF